MFSVHDLDDPLASIALIDDVEESHVVLAPARGGLVTRFTHRGREVLYLDEATLRDPTKNVRGGIPVLFPTPGKLTNDAWARDGRSGALKQHGFARNLPWRVVERSTDGGASVTLELVDDASTRAEYPWPFTLRITHRLAGAKLTLDITLENRGADPMPYGLGFHPYFVVADADKGRTRIPTHATRAFDNAAKRVVALDGIDLTRPEVDLHLEDHGSPDAKIEGVVSLHASPEFARWVVWTLAGKDFVCLEPWTSKADAMNDGVGLRVLAPAERAAMTFSIEAQ